MRAESLEFFWGERWDLKYLLNMLKYLDYQPDWKIITHNLTR